VGGATHLRQGPALTRFRYALLAALVAAAAAAVVFAFAGRRGELAKTPYLPPGRPIAADAMLTPQSHLFGELIHVRIDAVVDHRRIDPDRLRVRTHWAPYQTVAPLRRTRTDVGSYSRVSWDADLQCVIVDCAPAVGSAVRKTLDPSLIVYAGSPQPFEPLKVKWPEVNLFSRLDPLDLERRAAVVSRRGTNVQLRALLPPWRVTTSPLGATAFRFSPATVFWTALVLALLSVLAAARLLRPWLPQLGLFRRAPEPSRLERALAAVDRTRGGISAEERKALELLADELRRTGRGELAWTATELAWSTASPAPEQTGALTARVRRDLEERTNGHRA
jgi:hypothetical protein